MALARAFLRRPQLLILDEPTTYLDVESVQRLMGNLKKLDYVPTRLIIGHDADMVSQADYAYVLEEGRIVASGHPSTVLQAMAGSGIPA